MNGHGRHESPALRSTFRRLLVRFEMRDEHDADDTYNGNDPTAAHRFRSHARTCGKNERCELDNEPKQTSLIDDQGNEARDAPSASSLSSLAMVSFGGCRVPCNSDN